MINWFLNTTEINKFLFRVWMSVICQSDTFSICLNYRYLTHFLNWEITLYTWRYALSVLREVLNSTKIFNFIIADYSNNWNMRKIIFKHIIFCRLICLCVGLSVCMLPMYVCLTSDVHDNSRKKARRSFVLLPKYLLFLTLEVPEWKLEKKKLNRR